MKKLRKTINLKKAQKTNSILEHKKYATKKERKNQNKERTITRIFEHSLRTLRT